LCVFYIITNIWISFGENYFKHPWMGITLFTIIVLRDISIIKLIFKKLIKIEVLFLTVIHQTIKVVIPVSVVKLYYTSCWFRYNGSGLGIDITSVL